MAYRVPGDEGDDDLTRARRGARQQLEEMAEAGRRAIVPDRWPAGPPLPANRGRWMRAMPFQVVVDRAELRDPHVPLVARFSIVAPPAGDVALLRDAMRSLHPAFAVHVEDDLVVVRMSPRVRGIAPEAWVRSLVERALRPFHVLHPFRVLEIVHQRKHDGRLVDPPGGGWPMCAWLVPLAGPGAGEAIHLRTSEYDVGSLRMTRDDVGTWWLRSEGIVNGTPARDVFLVDHDHLLIDGVEHVFMTTA